MNQHEMVLLELREQWDLESNMADAATAVRKLQSGQPLTDAEKKLLGISFTPAKKTLTQEEIDAATAATVAAGGKSTDPANRLPGETASQANARITQGYKDQVKPDLTKEGEAAGATIEFVRTGAGGVGTYKEVFPIGAPIPTARTTESGNVYDEKGNLVSGTGLKTVTGGTKTPAQLEAERLQKIADEALAKSNASQAALKRLQDIQAKLARGETLTAEEYALIGVTPPTSTSSGDTQPGKAWIKGADGKWVKPTKPTDGKTYSWNDDTGWVVSTDTTDTIPIRPVGTPEAFIWDPITKTWKMPPKPTEEGSWSFDPNNGWVKTDVLLGSTGTSATEKGTLALNTFKNTLGLFFGAQEVTKPWVSELYKYVSGFYKTGSTIDEAFNLALQEGRFNPSLAEFSKRFKGIYALTDLRAKGGVVEVPTIAEYFATEAKMGDLLKSSNLGSLANEDFLGDILGKGVSATEFGNRIVAVFDRIDNASDINKKTLARFFPTLDRTQLAKALLTGEKGAKQLEQELSGYEVLSAAEQQGLGVSPTLPGGVTNEQAQQIAKGGGTYASTLGQFGQISQARETEQKLAEISGVKSLGVTGLTSAVISKSAAELKALENLSKQEEARFSGKAGNIGSKTFASQSRANRII